MAHPRSRGEHPEISVATSLHGGSSPLARGTPRSNLGLRLGLRLIPARAGNTSARLVSTLARAAHPRSRGEHVALPPPRSSRHGSSPLARGTRVNGFPFAVFQRLIPARAGNTVFSCASILAASAHPRSRGEHEVAGPAVVAGCGSSPLARGTLCLNHSPVLCGRLIPARAGNTTTSATTSTAAAAHPRSRGEH